MRPLTDEEMKVFFEKLSKYIGRNIRYLLDRPDEPYCFRLQRDRIYYLSEAIMLRATNISRDNLLSLGTCFGKFTKTGKVTLHVTCLDYLAQYAENKLWIKPAGEMSFVYGHHVLKSHVGRMTEDAEQYAGVVIFNMNDVPLGFGALAHGTAACRKLDPTAVVAFHQADVGEYLRSEDTLT